MLGIENRLKKDKEFRKIFSSARPFVSGHLSLRCRKNNSAVVRFGFVISNKIDKRSTHRNALKRRLRAIARNLISDIKPGYDIVVVVRENYPFPYRTVEIAPETEKGLRGLGILK